MTIEQAELKIQFLEAELQVLKFLNRAFTESHDEIERALRRYAACERDPSYARKALGVCEYWDQCHGKKFMRIRRVWRRLKEWWFGPCCKND